MHASAGTRLPLNNTKHSTQYYTTIYRWQVDGRANEASASPYRFIVSLTACNLLGSWVLLPLVVGDTFLAGWHSPALCRCLDAAAELVVASSVFATLLIAVDRFFAITDPLHYHMLVTWPKSVAMVASGWAIAAALAVAAALGDLSDRPWYVRRQAHPPSVHVAE